jgi:hypothetical protein
MTSEAGANQKQLNELNNRQLVELAIRSKSLTPLEVELMLRVELYLELYGDHLTEV